MIRSFRQRKLTTWHCRRLPQSSKRHTRTSLGRICTRPGLPHSNSPLGTLIMRQYPDSPARPIKAHCSNANTYFTQGLISHPHQYRLVHRAKRWMHCKSAGRMTWSVCLHTARDHPIDPVRHRGRRGWARPAWRPHMQLALHRTSNMSPPRFPCLKPSAGRSITGRT